MASAGPSVHANILRESKEDVFKKYEIVESLGDGSMGAVAKVRIRDGMVGGSAFPEKRGFLRIFRKKPKNAKLSEQKQDHFYALKSIQLDRISKLFLAELQNEIGILRNCDHPNVVKAYEVYNSRRQIYLVMELCDGGDLYRRSPYSERQAARIVAKLLSAIRYMHKKGIVHRDLKYENIMFENRREDAEIKVIDFGLSKKFLGKPGYMTERVGTVYTMAPQVLQGIYSSQADLWSTGVISYMLLSASKPFYHKRRRKMVDMIMRGAYSFDATVWKLVSDDAKDFVRKLLVIDPKKRMNADDASKHSWIVHREQLPDEKPSEEVLATIDDSLLNYGQTSDLKKLALTVVAHRSTTEDILQLRKVFDSFDTEKDGTLSFTEFREALKELNYSEETLQEIFASIDINQNGHINWTEFLAATIEAHGHIEEDRIAEAFDRIDSDDSGYISKENLAEVLGRDCSPERIDEIIRQADINGDGKISYEEFLQAFRCQTVAMAAEVEPQSFHASEEDLLGLEAKIPGGRYDSNLSPSEKAQLNR